MDGSVRQVAMEYERSLNRDRDSRKPSIKVSARWSSSKTPITQEPLCHPSTGSQGELWHDSTSTQIQLLQRAIDLLKTHASEAGTNLARLRSLMADDSQLDSKQLSCLQRQRWLEERRESDATKALWSTYQQAEAIVTDDQAFFDYQREAEERRCRWYEAQEEAERREYGPPLEPEQRDEGGFYVLPRKRRPEPPQVSPDSQSKASIPTAEHVIPVANGLIPLTLAYKADQEALQPKRPTPASSLFSSSAESSDAAPELRNSSNPPFTDTSHEDHAEDLDDTSDYDESTDVVRGTVTIFRLNGPGSRHKSRKPSTSSTFRRFAEEQVGDVSMPDYVADLLSEFDGQTAVPTLSLLSPSPSLPDRTPNNLISPSPNPEPSRPPSPPTVTSPKSAPSSPVRTRRVLKRMPSTKRISGFFSKRPSMSSLRQPESPYPLHATQIPSRLGSSIDLVIAEEAPFGLSLDFDNVGRKSSGSFASPTLSQGNWGNSPISPSGLNPNRYSDSVAMGTSMVSLMSSQETTTSGSTSVVPPALGSSATTFSLPSRHSEDTPAASTTPVAQPPSSHEGRRFAERLKKRMSALRF